MPPPRRRGRPIGRNNPTGSGPAAFAYVEKLRTKEVAKKILQGAEIGYLFAHSTAGLTALRTWLSRKSTRWHLDQARAASASVYTELIRDLKRDSLATGPAGGLSRDIGDLNLCVVELQRLAERISSQLSASPELRRQLQACTNERNMLVLFACRAAEGEGVPLPGGQELAALAVCLDVEKPTSSPERNAQLLDVYRQIRKELARLKEALASVTRTR